MFSFFQVLLPKLRMHISLMHATCPVHIIFSDFVIFILFGEEYKLRSSLLCNSSLLSVHLLSV
jgi:hypothetical protein